MKSNISCTDRTAWFPGTVKPVRKGVYERDHFFGVRFSYWNGEFWGGWAQRYESAVANACSRSVLQEQAWRGLRKPK